MPQATDCLSAQLTIASRHGDFVDWRQGRSHYAVWAIDLDMAALRTSTAAIRAHLADYLLPGYQRQPHLTLAVCGFPSVAKQRTDDFDAAALAGQIAALEGLCQAPFALEIGAPASFTSAAYFAVNAANGVLSRLHQALNGPPAPACPFLPHLTFGLYRDCFSLQEVLMRLRDWPPLPPCSVAVNRLSLMVYQAAQIGGALQTLAEFDLTDQRWHQVNHEQMQALFGDPCAQ
jgi:2'-5' RNA ligase